MCLSVHIYVYVERVCCSTRDLRGERLLKKVNAENTDVMTSTQISRLANFRNISLWGNKVVFAYGL